MQAIEDNENQQNNSNQPGWEALPSTHILPNLNTSNAMIPSKWTDSIPFITLPLALFSILTSCTFLGQTLQYDRIAMSDGQLWLSLTCHLSHWSLDHLLWDLAVFMVLGVMVERHTRRGLILCLTLSALLISTIIWFWQPNMTYYRGLSGIDSALFGFTALWMTRKRLHSKDLKGAGLILLPSIAFFLKIVYEFITLQTVFTRSIGTFTPVPIAHLAGFLVGVGVALFFSDSRAGEWNQVLLNTPDQRVQIL